MGHSALTEVAEQLWVDTADDARLDALSARHGLRRPHGGYDDRHWRALTRAIAKRDHQTRDAFRRVIEACAGPQWSRPNVLASASVAGDRRLSLLATPTRSSLTYHGTLRLDPGMSTEETIAFERHNGTTGDVRLLAETRFDHPVVSPFEATLFGDVVPTQTTITLFRTIDVPLPTTYPFPILVGRGTVTEEVVVALSLSGSSLLTTPFQRAHTAHRHEYRRTTLLSDLRPGGRMVVRVSPSSIAGWPSSGMLFLGDVGKTIEYVMYSSVDYDNGLFYLSLPASPSPAMSAGVSVILVTPGDRVEPATVVQDGLHWDITEPGPRRVVVYMPRDTQRLRLVDASYLHDQAPKSFSTTLAVAASPGDTELQVTSAAGFVEGAAMVRVASATVLWYIERQEAASPNPKLILAEPLTVGLSGGATVETWELPYASTDLEEGNIRDASGIVQSQRYTGPYVYAPAEYAPGPTASTLATQIAARQSVAYAQGAGRYALEVREASSWTAGATARVGRGAGRQEDRVVAQVKRRVVVGSTTVSGAHSTGSTTLTVASSAAFPTGTAPLGYRLRVNSTDTLIVRSNNGATVFTLERPTTTAYSGGETVVLWADVLVFGTALTSAHSVSEYVEELVSRVTVADGGLFGSSGYIVINHGWQWQPAAVRISSVISSTVYELRTPPEFSTTVRLSTLGGDTTLPVVRQHHYPQGGDGQHALGFRLVVNPLGGSQETVTALANPPSGAGSISLTAGMANAHSPGEVVRLITQPLPSSGYPLPAVLGWQSSNEEAVTISSFDAALNRITIGAPINTHVAGEFLYFGAGAPEVLEFVARDGNALTLATPVVLESFDGHLAGEDVCLSSGESEAPDDGSGDAFYLPPEPGWCTREILEQIKAAGVTVELTDVR